MQGRKPKPSGLKAIEGSRNPLNPFEFRPEVAIPEAPDHLSDEAKAEWDRITPELFRYRVLSEVDRTALVMYCVAWGRHVLAERMIAKAAEEDEDKQGLFVATPTGYMAQTSWLAVSNKAMEFCYKFLTEFGMTPSSRTRVMPTPPTKPKGVPKDGFDAL